MLDLSSSGVTPPATGQALAENLRKMYQQESQYLARMFKHFQFTPYTYYPCDEALLGRYKKALTILLRYIALDRGRFVLTRQAISEWIEYEYHLWSAIYFLPLPALQFWYGVQAAQTSNLTEVLSGLDIPLGPAVQAELERFQRLATEATQTEGSYKPSGGDRSLSYVMTLVLLDSPLRDLLLPWIKAIDARYPRFFSYAIRTREAWQYSTEDGKPAEEDLSSSDSEDSEVEGDSN